MKYILIVFGILLVILYILVYNLFNKINTLLRLNDDILKHNGRVLSHVGNVIDTHHNMSIDEKVLGELVQEHGNRLAHSTHVISMLIEHTKYDALKGYKL